MVTLIAVPKVSKAGTAITGKKAAPISRKKEAYVIYSIYYANEPDEGYVVYSNDQSGWEFFGHMPAKQQPSIELQLCTKLSDLL